MTNHINVYAVYAGIQYLHTKELIFENVVSQRFPGFTTILDFYAWRPLNGLPPENVVPCPPCTEGT